MPRPTRLSDDTDASRNIDPSGKRKAAVTLTVTALDTTWRMFLPTIGGTLLGIYIDNMFDTIPLFTVLFVVGGVILAGVLVMRQLRDIRGER